MHHKTILPGIFWMIKAAYETWEVPQVCLISDSTVTWTEMLELKFCTVKEGLYVCNHPRHSAIAESDGCGRD